MDTYIRDLKRDLWKKRENDKEVALDMMLRKHLTTSGYADIQDTTDKAKAILRAKQAAIGMAEFMLRRHLPFDYVLLQKEVTISVYEDDNLVCAYIIAQWH